MKRLVIGLFSVFIIAFFIRFGFIRATRVRDFNIDLEIYRVGGLLTHNRINPYNYNDGVYYRTYFLKGMVSPFKNGLPELNYYASSNLPFNLLFFGAIDILNSHPYVYRLVFTFFDSILSVLAFYFVYSFWQNKKNSTFIKLIKLSIGLLLGTLSFILIQNGTINAEDKGIEILLILAFILCFLSKKRYVFSILGSIFFALSIAFKGLGIVFLPLYLVRLIKDKSISRKEHFYSLAIVIILSTIWFIPYSPSVFKMMWTRFTGNINTPGHASIWVAVYQYFPNIYPIIRPFCILLSILLLAYGLIYKSLSLLDVSGGLIFVSTTMLLTAGSLDRMNIGILLGVLLAGKKNFWFGTILTIFYTILGIVSFRTESEYYESILSSILLIIYFIGYSIIVFSNKKIKQGSKLIIFS